MKKNSLLLIFSSLIAIYAIIGFVAVPKIVKPQIVKALNDNLTEKATLEKVEFNPFLLKFTAHKLKIFNDKETTVSADKLFIDFSLFKSIDEQHISFRNLELINPFINVIQYEDGTLNLQKLAKKKEEIEKKDKNPSEKSDIKFQIYKTIIDNASIKFTKLAKNEEPYKLNINKLNYTFYDMGTYRNTLASHNLRILINKNSELIIRGGLRLDPFKMYGNVELNNFRPNQFLTYEKDMLNFDLSDETYFDLKFGYKVDASDKLKIEINNTFLNLNNLDLQQNNNSILSLKNLAVENLNLNYPQNKVVIDSIFFNKLNSKAIINKNGTLNFANLIKSDEPKKEPVAKIKTEEKLTKVEDIQKKEEKKIVTNTTSSNVKPWEVVLKKLNIKDSNVSFQDLVNTLFVDTKNINIDMSNFNLNGKDFTLDNLAITKPTINFKDEKNKIDILTKELEVLVNNIKSKNSQIDLDSVNVKNSGIKLNDLKNAISLGTANVNLNLKTFNLNDENILLESLDLNTPKLSFNDKKNKVSVNTNGLKFKANKFDKKAQVIRLSTANITIPKTTFKDNKNKLQVFTKTTTAAISNIKKENENTTISNIILKNPSIFLRDYKNSLKIITNSLSLEAQTLNLKGSNITLKKAKLKTPSVKFNNLDTKMDITSKNINVIATNLSMIKEKLKIAYLSLTKPSIYMVDNKNDKTIVAKKLSLKINGISNFKDSLYISKVNLYQPNISIKDRKAKTDIIAKNIYLNVKKISNKKNKLKIVSSSINKPYISITLGKQDPKPKTEEGKKEAVKEPIKVSKKVKKKSDFQFDIGPVKIKNMKMTFEDKNLPIPFKTNISELKGNFSRLNSNSSKPTKLQLEGKVDEYGYTKITGTVDINDIKLLTDTNLLFKNIAIKNFTPYTGKFIGREIESGKLNLDLKYNIKKSDLNASNSVIISDIKLGKNVKSPDAVNLPLELAIALLEDSDGVIDIDLPVTGNVDDPQFSIAPIVWKVFFNLIMKAITSPFALLGAMLGVDEEKMKSLEFEFGKSDILASEKESLDNIAKILAKKPKLAIKIKPVYNPSKDKVALQNIKFEQFLIKEMDKIPEGDDYKEALEDIYDDLDGVKDLDDIEKSFTKKNKDGKKTFDNEGYVEYLRNFLVSKQKVTEKELVDIAKARIANIMKYLLVNKKVPKDAIILEDITKQDKKDTKWAIFDLDVGTK